MAENTEKNNIQQIGMAYYDNRKLFFFAPENPVPGTVGKYRARGVAQQMSDGTFDFVARPKPKPESIPILKLAHGRVSLTKDGAVQLTVKVFRNEHINIPKTISHEAFLATEALEDYQLKNWDTKQ